MHVVWAHPSRAARVVAPNMDPRTGQPRAAVLRQSGGVRCWSRGFIIGRQREAEFAATALAAPRPDLAALRLDQPLTHGEADAESRLVRRRPARTIECGEHCIDLV